MFTLTDLTTMIRKCCSRPEAATSTTSRYQFEIDFAKLENMLKQKKTNLHTIGMNKIVLSRPIDIVNDAQFISEYITNRNVLQASLSDGTEIVQFMMFSTETENGTLRPKYEDGEGNIVDIQDKELFSMLNDPEQVSEDLIKEIIMNYPVYRVIVVRLFNEKNDRYDYNVNIRSNYHMISYMRNLTAAESAEKPAEEEKKEEPVVEESAETENKPAETQDN